VRQPGAGRSIASAPAPLNGAADLGTAFEWLAVERDGDAGGPVSSIRWIDIVDSGKVSLGKHDGGAEAGGGKVRVPLYPLPATYLPSGAMQMLNNVEPRNMKMAQDLADEGGPWDGIFCVVLRAADTGRIAEVGTLMRVVDVEEHRSYYDKSLLRISVRCQAEGVVRIESIENPDAWSAESRLYRLDEYLIAGVCTIGKKPSKSEGSSGDSDDDSIVAVLSEGSSGDTDDDSIVAVLAERLCSDYGIVRSMYVDEAGVAARDLPPFAVDAVQNIPELTVDDFRSEVAFWDSAEAWQVLCNTVREARRCDIQSNVNEIMIAAATKKGGPLNLPIHRKDLPMKVQTKIRQLEEDAANDFVALGMDPCLDFQALISCKSHAGRLKHLHQMISREKSRLKAKEKLKALFANEDGGQFIDSAEDVTGFE